jgi:hypothetical protein
MYQPNKAYVLMHTVGYYFTSLNISQLFIYSKVFPPFIETDPVMLDLVQPG